MTRKPKRTITFYKASGSGNDFILIDNRRGALRGVDPSQLAASICRQHLSVGGDGLILFEKPRGRGAQFRWRLFNADGSEAEMSGNGGRCAARVAYLLGIAPKKMTFETLAGPVHAEITGRGGATVKIEMPAPHGLQLDLKLPFDGETRVGHFINTGVPHFVYLVQDAAGADVFGIGRKTRQHEAFKPAGTNVNFAKITGRHTIEMRTYERGVEDETLACGTGATATALIAGALGLAESPLRLRQKSGQLLTVYFSWDGRAFGRIFLEGDARVIYKGELWDEGWKQ
jgi:diaminopimelate epimerase